MMSTLSTQDQTPKQDYSLWEAAERGTAPSLYGYTSDRGGPLNESDLAAMPAFSNPQSVGLSDFDQQSAGIERLIHNRRPAMSIENHLCRAPEVLAALVRLQRRSERDHGYRAAQLWLSENRHKWVGQWIALQGSRLIASGKTGKEVYARVLAEEPPALVIKIEDDSVPFGGW